MPQSLNQKTPEISLGIRKVNSSRETPREDENVRVLSQAQTQIPPNSPIRKMKCFEVIWWNNSLRIEMNESNHSLRTEITSLTSERPTNEIASVLSPMERVSTIKPQQIRANQFSLSQSTNEIVKKASPMIDTNMPGIRPRKTVASWLNRYRYNEFKQISERIMREKWQFIVENRR